MEKWIERITGTIPYTNKTVDIELNGKNLIVTGANGSGKTSFVKTLHENIIITTLLVEAANFVTNKKNIDLTSSIEALTKGVVNIEAHTKEGETFAKEFKTLAKEFNNLNIDDADTQYFVKRLKNLQNNNSIVNISNLKTTHIFELTPNFVDLKEFVSQLYDNKAIIHFYEEKRLSEIKQPKIGQQINIERNQKLGNDLEQHLLNLKMRASFAITEKPNTELASGIQKWFNDFEHDLKELFEDVNLTLNLNLDEVNPHFDIIQKDKPPFTFQTLSAGYRAIFDIYADLLMHTEYFKIMPNELTGIVFIDEIDSHLHVSLQRLILPFFTKSFPKIQFIVTTHSPFVLMSAKDTVIFDLANNKPITEDLSYYTYSAVMKGLWGVKPISVHLENSIKEIVKIINTEQKDYKQLKELVENTRPYMDALDNESKVFLMLGMETLEEGGENV